jgi:hypothetical protein
MGRAVDRMERGETETSSGKFESVDRCLGFVRCGVYVGTR